MIKGDIEVYAGFYLIASIFIGGGSSLIGAMFYWQMMRMRYMMSPAIQASFGKVDNSI